MKNKSSLFTSLLVFICLLFLLTALVGAEDLLIICPGPEEFIEAVQPLVEHKNNTGVPTLLIELEWISTFPTFNGGDIAEEVKKAIKYYHENNSIKYVLLFGDVDKIPVRWVTIRKENDPDTAVGYFPSDLYYADLYDESGGFSTWDSDGDGYFGEHLRHNDYMIDPYTMNADHVDFHPDVAVGRVPASTIEEVEIYISKVITYEYKTAHDPNDWFHNVLLLSGEGRYCDPGIHFDDIQSSLGSDFNYNIFIDNSYYVPNPLKPEAPCNCDPNETLPDCYARTHLFTVAQIDIFNNADDRLNRVTNAEFENVGFLGWHDHTSGVRNYYTQVNNNMRYSIAFTDGCSDGGFAGKPIGLSRFLPASSGGQDLFYKETGGRELKVVAETRFINNRRYYRIIGCMVNNVFHSRDGDHCSGGILPDMRFEDDFVSDTAILPVDNNPRYERGLAYIYNPPLPHPLQPSSCDYDNRNPGTKLFSQWHKTGDDTGWVGLVAATKGASFAKNGELEYLFFRSYWSPYPTVTDEGHLGDMWRSMMEYWLYTNLFDASGNFDLLDLYNKYSGDLSKHKYGCWDSVQHAFMYALFGDPSLRVGGVDSIDDDNPPSTTDDADDDWHNSDVTVTFTATDHGSPASGVRKTKYRIDGKDWQSGSQAIVEAPADHSYDGIHTIEYFSIDFAGNKEDPVKTAEVKIDTYPPGSSILLNDEPPAFAFCMCYGITDCECPERGCYNGSVTISLSGGDNVPEPSPHEQWNRIIEGRYNYELVSISPTNDGGYILTGSVENGGQGTGIHDIYFLKVDSRGYTDWSSYFGDNDLDNASAAVQQTSDGGYILVGERELSVAAGGGTEIWLIKRDSAGGRLWDRGVGGPDNEYSSDIRQTSDGGFIIAGTSESGTSSSALIIKTNASGVEQWTQSFGGIERDKALAVQQTCDGGYIILGETTSYGSGSADAWLIKTDANGVEEWNRTYGGDHTDLAFALEQTSDGGYIIAGCARSFGDTYGDAWLIKTDDSGDEIWSRTFGGTSMFDEARDVKQTPDGGYIIIGNTSSYGAGASDIWLIKTSSGGYETWARTFGGSREDKAFSIQLTGDGGYVIAGHTDSNRINHRDAWLIKIFFNAPVASGYDHSEYYYHGAPCVYGYCPYTTPLTLGANDYLVTYDFQYLAYDAAGNHEAPVRHSSFCVSDWDAGLWREEADILAALEEIIAIQMIPELDLPFEPLSAHYEFAGPIDEGELEWTTIGTNITGEDNWGMHWDTRKVSNGDYYVRMTVFGQELQRNKDSQSEQLPEKTYQEQFRVTVCNVPESDYTFTLSAPDEVERQGTIQYTLTYVNKSDVSLLNARMTCILDLNLFDYLKVQDNGDINEDGLPSWYRQELKADESWIVHVEGKLKAGINPGTTTSSQAVFSADTIPRLLSGDPSTLRKKDATRVSVKLEYGKVYGQVQEYKYKTPLSAEITVKGPVSKTGETDNYGKYRITDLPPGTYNVGVLAEGYEYHLPDASATVQIDGSGKSVQANFLMRPVDSTPPQTEIDHTMEQIIQENITQITGTASDPLPGSGLNKVEINIRRLNDGRSWDGDSWDKGEIWLIASGTSEWVYESPGIKWMSSDAYTIQARATDRAGNTGAPYVTSNTEDLELAMAYFDRDLDQDGVYDIEDNCPEIKNPDQLDSDNNGWGDVCEIAIENYCIDADKDGYGDTENCIQSTSPPDGYVSDNTDCDDSDSSKFPGNPEICDGKDNDCDGQVDEGKCTIYYKDEDNDGQGVAGGSRCLCAPNELGKYTAIYSGDPDDSDPNIQGTILTGNMNLPSGWSMISLPLMPENACGSSVFPGSVVMYGYQRGIGYVRVKDGENLEAEKGYWILLNEAKTYSLTGAIIDEYNLSVQDGWYMVGGCTSDAKASGDNCNIGVIYGYEQGFGYKRFQKGETLEAGKGYWILLEYAADQASLSVQGRK